MTYDPSHSGDQDRYGLTQHRFILTVFPDNFAKSLQAHWLTLPELAEMIRGTEFRSKGKLPLLKLASFGDSVTNKGCYRSNANMGEISGVEVEHDAGFMAVDQAVQLLAGANLRALLYTTPSHTTAAPRWRALLPLSVSEAVDKRADYVMRVNAVLGGALAPESLVQSQAFYFGHLKGRADFQIHVIDGSDFIDCCDDIVPRALIKPEHTKAGASAANEYSSQSIEELVKYFTWRGILRGTARTSAEWHNPMLALTAKLIARGDNITDAAEICGPYCDGGEHDLQLLDMLNSATAKGFAPPQVDADAIAAGLKKLVDNQPALAALIPPSLPNWPHRTARGALRSSMTNAMMALEAIGVICRRDLMKDRIQLSTAETWAKPPLFIGEISDSGIIQLRVELQRAFTIDFDLTHINEAVTALADRNAFDPVADMLDRAQADWDGVPRLDRLAVDYFRAEDTPLNSAFVRKMMLAAVSRIREPGIKFDTMVVFESPQGWDKSTALRVLAGDEYFSDAVIDVEDAKDALEKLAGVWIHEKAELEGLRKADTEALKAYLSRQVDRARPAYGRHTLVRPRRSIEVGTTNSALYLQASDGNRRFWPVEVLAPVDVVGLARDRLQLWGEAAAAQAGGESLVLDRELWEVAAAEQEERRIRDPWEVKVSRLRPQPTMGGPIGDNAPASEYIIQTIGSMQFVATLALLRYLMGSNFDRATPHDMRRASNVMRAAGWTPTRPRVDGEKLRGFKKGHMAQIIDIQRPGKRPKKDD